MTIVEGGVSYMRFYVIKVPAIFRGIVKGLFGLLGKN